MGIAAAVVAVVAAVGLAGVGAWAIWGSTWGIGAQGDIATGRVVLDANGLVTLTNAAGPIDPDTGVEVFDPVQVQVPVTLDAYGTTLTPQMAVNVHDWFDTDSIGVLIDGEYTGPGAVGDEAFTVTTNLADLNDEAWDPTDPDPQNSNAVVTITPSAAAAGEVIDLSAGVTATVTGNPAVVPGWSDSYTWLNLPTIPVTGNPLQAWYSINTTTEVAPMEITGGQNLVVDWGDGSPLTTALSHSYAQPGDYLIKVYGTFTHIRFGQISPPNGVLTSLEAWGSNDRLTSLEAAFKQIPGSFTINEPPPTTVTNFNYLFSEAGDFDQNISDWDTSNVANMEGTFYRALSFNQPMDNWTTSNVTNMYRMFNGAIRFNQPLRSWDVSRVERIRGMFGTDDAGVTGYMTFNGDITTWNLRSAYEPIEMFRDNVKFNQPIGEWDVSGARRMDQMFEGATAFNQDLSAWQVQNVEAMTRMFRQATAMNQNLCSWPVFGIVDGRYQNFSTGAHPGLIEPNWNNPGECGSAAVTVNTIFAGASYSAQLGTDGKTYTWGWGRDGQLGNGSTADATRPTAVSVPAGVTFTQISAGNSHMLAVGSDGKAYAWGRQWDGRLGNGSSADASISRPVEVRLPAGVTFTKMAGGNLFSVALGSDGKAYAWGHQYSGEFGNGTSGDRISTTPTAVSVPAGVTFTQIATGEAHTLALGSDGKTYAWGRGSNGRLGTGSTLDATRPTAVSVPAGVTFTQIAGGYDFSVALGSNGKAYAWGNGANGRLGTGSTASSTVPVEVKAPPGVTFTQIDAVSHHAVAVGSDGKAYAWGAGTYGRLGNGSYADSSSPVVVSIPVGVTVTEVAAGVAHSLALGSDGKTYAWGRGSNGALGNGSTGDSSVPVVVAMPAAGVTAAQATADAAQGTADAAQSTADAAQGTADAARSQALEVDGKSDGGDLGADLGLADPVPPDLLEDQDRPAD